jgi:SagB-type dehydrogenase family enzyme
VINLLAGLKSIDGRRQYPSAGGIYSVNIWVAMFPDRLVTSLQSGIYRYNHETNRLDHVLDCAHSHFVNSFHPSIEHEHEFSFAVFFTLDLKLALAKYRQRGILFGAMEAGSIYQELIHISQSLGLRSLVFGGYRLHTLCRTLGINQLNQFPLVMQLFGND